MNLNVIVHLVDIPGSENIANDILNRIIDSGLINNASVFVYCQYNKNNFTWVEDKLKDYPAASVIYTDSMPHHFEISTLVSLQALCNDNESYVLYLHHKGASKLKSKKTANITDWRELMLYYTVDCWQQCVSSLTDGFDTVGVNWMKDSKYPHYAGNFWWATSKYINHLPELKLPEPDATISQFNFENYPYRHDAEFWIGIGKPNACSLHESNVDHYRSPYNQSLYKGKI